MHTTIYFSPCSKFCYSLFVERNCNIIWNTHFGHKIQERRNLSKVTIEVRFDAMVLCNIHNFLRNQHSLHFDMEINCAQSINTLTLYFLFSLNHFSFDDLVDQIDEFHFSHPLIKCLKFCCVNFSHNDHRSIVICISE